MSNPFGLDTFIAEMGRGSVARPANFYVQIGAPLGTTSQATIERSLPLRIEAVNMPGRSVSTYTRHVGMSRPREIPYSFATLPVQIAVILSEDMRERQYFLGWQDLLVGQLRASRSGESPLTNEVGYYDNGVGTIDILQFGESPAYQGRGAAKGLGSSLSDIAQSLGFDPSLVTKPLGFDPFNLSGAAPNITFATKITLHEVYPFTVNDQPMGWGETNTYARLAVEFRYAYYTEQHAIIDEVSLADKSNFRKAIEGLGRFIPIASSIHNIGLKNTGKSVLGNLTGQADGPTGVVRALNPFG